MALKAVILCGGKGERLRPLTTTMPKPLIPIKDKPILNYILSHLKKHGVEDYIIASGYKAEKIEEFFESFKEYNSLEIINSGDVDMIKRIQDAEKFIEDDFMVLYGDTLSDVDLSELKNFHNEKAGNASVTLHPLRSQFGIMEVREDGVISEYLEKPLLNKWVNIGYFYFSKEIFSEINSHETFESFLLKLIQDKNLNGYKHSGVHITVNTRKELSEAEDHIDELGF